MYVMYIVWPRRSPLPSLILRLMHLIIWHCSETYDTANERSRRELIQVKLAHAQQPLDPSFSSGCGHLGSKFAADVEIVASPCTAGSVAGASPSASSCSSRLSSYTLCPASVLSWKLRPSSHVPSSLLWPRCPLANWTVCPRPDGFLCKPGRTPEACCLALPLESELKRRPVSELILRPNSTAVGCHACVLIRRPTSTPAGNAELSLEPPIEPSWLSLRCF